LSIEERPVDAATVSKNMMWNVAGSMFFIGAQWIITVLIVHLADFEQAGYLSLALSISNVFSTICYYYVRSFQVSDVRGEFSDGCYVAHRWFMTFLSIGVGTIFILVNGYEPFLALFLILFLVYRISEPNADVYHGIDQKSWRLDVAGKSFVMRGIISIAAFVGMMLVTHDLVKTALVMALGVWAVVFLYDIPQAKKLSAHRAEWNFSKIIGLTKTCFPLFLYFLFINMIMPVPRYFLEKIESGTILGYYSSVAVPASMIPMLASFVFNTFIGLFTEKSEKGDKKGFVKLFWMITLVIVAITAGAMIGSWLLGEWILALVFTDEIRPYAYLLIPTVAVCGMYSMVQYMGMVLTVLRDKKSLMYGAGIAALVVTLSSYPAIRLMGVDGINVAMLTGCMMAVIYLGVRLYVDCRRMEGL